MNILVTGGAGYIGSHTLIELVKAGHSPVVVDNLCNSSAESLHRVEEIVGKPIPLYEVSVQNYTAMRHVFETHTIDAIIHFAGLKAVGESVEKPLDYYTNNIGSSLVLLKLATEFSVKKFIFSSSATVYGTPEELPLAETSRTGVGITSSYGQTKYTIEQVLRDVSVSDPSFEITLLRYFNPVGADASGLIGERPNGTPNNLMPFIVQVASGQRQKLSIFGNDYPTPDGTCLRDYIHVVDLARGHIAALEHLRPGVSVYNLGTGKPTSVLELVSAFTKTTGQDVAHEFAPRRPGDIPEFYADPTKAEKELGWQATLSLEDMCRDSWNWQKHYISSS